MIIISIVLNDLLDKSLVDIKTNRILYKKYEYSKFISAIIIITVLVDG